MATYKVSGTVDLDISWEADAEVRLIATNDEYGFEVEDDEKFSNVLQPGDVKLMESFEIEVESDSEKEAEDLVVKKLQDKFEWSIMSEIGGREDMVSTWLDNIDVDITNVELVDA